MCHNEKSLEEIMAEPLPPRPPHNPDYRMITYMEESEKSRLRRLAKEDRKRARQAAKQRQLADQKTPG